MSTRLEAVAATVKRLEPRLRSEFGVRALYIFGSVARDEANDASDLDVLVEFEQPGKFAQFMDLKFLLEDECGIRVDLVTRDALRPVLKEQVLSEARRVA